MIASKTVMILALIALHPSLLLSDPFVFSPALALQGYDPVSYHLDGEPRKGSDEFAWEWNDTIWHFTSREYLELFQGDPERYAPQFNGACANGLSDQHLIGGNPRIWTIIDGKLYIFFSQFGRRQFLANPGEKTPQANQYYENLN